VKDEININKKRIKFNIKKIQVKKKRTTIEIMQKIIFFLNFWVGGGEKKKAEEKKKVEEKKSSCCLTIGIQPPLCLYAYPFLPHKTTLYHT
jgi:hypothetical protein